MNNQSFLKRLIGRTRSRNVEKSLDALLRKYRFLGEQYIASCTEAALAEAALAFRESPEHMDYASLLSLHPEWQRILFIHIPKCGGTSVRRSLVQDARCVPLPVGGSLDAFQATEFMLRAVGPDTIEGEFIRGFADSLDTKEHWQRYLHVLAAYRLSLRPERAFILGHRTARELAPLKRGNDDLYICAVRDPGEILKSYAAYRVHHVLLDATRPDSIEVLEELQLGAEAFAALAVENPRKLTESILEKGAPSMARFFAFGESTNAEELWQGIREQRILICHVSEQGEMLGRILDQEIRALKQNRSTNREGLSASFTAAVDLDWTEPFVDLDSRRLYEKIQNSGIFGFWQEGGTVEEYRTLLR